MTIISKHLGGMVLLALLATPMAQMGREPILEVSRVDFL